MKPIRPRSDPGPGPGYPTVETHQDQSTNRRECLRRLVAGLGAGAAALAGGDALAGGRASNRVIFRLRSRYHLAGCDYVVDWLDLQTGDGRLAAFLRDAREHGGLEDGIRRVLGAATCRDVTDRKRLAALERRLAGAILARYRARQRRRPGALIVTLSLSRHRPPVPGGIRAPANPLPRP